MRKRKVTHIWILHEGKKIPGVLINGRIRGVNGQLYPNSNWLIRKVFSSENAHSEP